MPDIHDQMSVMAMLAEVSQDGVASADVGFPVGADDTVLALDPGASVAGEPPITAGGSIVPDPARVLHARFGHVNDRALEALIKSAGDYKITLNTAAHRISGAT